MELGIKDIAHLLLLSEREIKELIKKGALPHQIIQEQVWFNRQQIVEWALGRNLPLNLSRTSRFREYHVETIATLLDRRSFFYDCDFTEGTYIDWMAEHAHVGAAVDRELLAELLKSREELMSTAIGNGISLPHPRIPLIVGRSRPLIHFFFPRRPLQLASIDGKPVHTLILVISQTVHQHLSLLAHMSFLLGSAELRTMLAERRPCENVLAMIKTIEEARSR